ncbi:conserved hypothetical protein [Culex quinquefasciatus]|uniref:DUF753 domain-containing protein n=1 Tax=Culex quinquefasciatus TaxID=7176 RepID=B0VZE0_CULQU|nr:conserved hypothetical protein [Culex quinquefasciatus]|eukprot:XP_001841824.1 conserved hypothetical protein [Culex quinquefasciatus]
MSPKSVVLVVVLSVFGSRSVSALNCFQCNGATCTNEATLGNVVQCPDGDLVCFSQFNGFLLTRRGCWSELGGEVSVADCSGGDCARCQEEYCNGLSRTDHKCVSCTSTADGQCISNAQDLPAMQCEAASVDLTKAQCYTRIIGSTTERGCVESERTLEECTSPTCQTCTGNGCNTAVFPAGRQMCVSCSGAAECNAQTSTEYCALPYDSCVTLQRSDGTYVKSCEGAMATTDQTFCQANPDKCSYCGMNACNKAELNTATSRKCYHCEGTGCLQTSVNIETCHNSDDVCFSMFDGFNPVLRGCKSQLSQAKKAQCEDENDKSCQLCADDVCNLVSHVDHKCEYCSSVFDTNCITAPNSPVQCPAPTTEVSADAQCYTRVIGSVTERGCLGSATDALACDSTENCQTCAIENGAACNKAIFPTDRIQCVVGNTADQYCPNPADSCVQIANNGETITKKCQSSMTAAEVSFCEANSNKCDFCWANNCNQQAITFNYLECFSCESTVDGHCTTNPSAITTVDHCTTCATLFSTSTNALKRGCLQSLTAAEQAQCAAGDSSCSTCTTNRCNGVVFPADRLSCYSCAQGECHSHDGISVEYCGHYSQGDSCVTRLDSSGKVTWMGCLSSLSSAVVTTCNGNANLCRKCSTANCNEPGKVLASGSCVQCISSTDPDCVEAASNFVVQPCNDPQNSACYSRLTSTGATERGCFSDLDSTSKTRCQAGTDCRMCSTRARCNSLEFPIQIKCFQCDSTTTPECKNAQLGTPSNCPAYNTANKCFTVVQENGDTVRKCGTGTRDATCGSSKSCEQCLFSGCNKRVSTAIVPTIIPKPEIVPIKSSANGRFVVGGNLALLIVVVVRSILMR